MSDSTCLVSFDTDRIKEYLFAAPDLQRIRGASTLLDILNRGDDPNGSSTYTVIRDVYPSIKKDEEMIAVGGMAMALVPEQLAPQVIAAVESLYRRETVTAGITGAMLPVTKHDLEHRFGECIAKVSKRLRTAKDQKGQDPFVPLAAWLRPCESCGRYPARHLSTSEGRTELVCRSCFIKERPGKKVRNRFFKEFIKFLKRIGRDGTRWEDAFPKDFGAIGETAHPSGYLGFIYADGNGMGRLLEQIQSFPAFREFANGLDTIVRYITHQALADTFTGPLHETAPFEILLMGGDDLMLVVAADAALEIAATIVKEFEQRANALAHSQAVGLPRETHLSISAGVVIAHDRFPIQAMHELSGDLVKSAKRKTAEISAELRRSGAQPAETPKDQGTIDFMVVTEAATAGLDVVRDQVLTDGSFFVTPERSEKCVLTERPYTARQLQKLLVHIRELKARGFPTTVLNAMYEALFESKARAQIATLTAMVRAKPDHRSLARQFFKDFHVSDTLLPWRDREDGSYSSPLGDLIEIYPFIPAGDESVD